MFMPAMDLTYQEGNASLINKTASLSTVLEVLYLRTNLALTLFMSAVLVIGTVAGTLGNLLVVLTILVVPNLRTCGNMFILNLALADLVITVLVDPLNAVGAISGENVFVKDHKTLCNFIGSICAPICMTSMWNMCAISLNRYIRICHQPSYHWIFTKRNTFVMCLAVWLFCYAINIPNHTGWSRIAFDTDFYICTSDMVHAYSFAVFYVIMGVFLPFLGIVFGYVKIFCKVRMVKQLLFRHRSNQIHAILDASKVNSSTSKEKPSPSKLIMFSQEDLKLAKTLFMAFIVFSICWMPFSLLVVVGRPTNTPKWIYVIAMIMAHGNSAMNPILYGLCNERFRQGYRRIIGIRPRFLGPASVIPKPAATVRERTTPEAQWSSCTKRVKIYQQN